MSETNSLLGGPDMEQLVAVLEQIIEKYQIEEQDVVAIQEALDAAQGMGEDEFVYTEEQ
jgi:hypothetical protein